MLSDEMRYRLMRLLKANPRLSQRDVARELDISLGRVNYILKALIERGWIKAAHFRNSQNKAAYMYLLTSRGLEAKAALTMRFLQAKLREYENLQAEIEEVRREVNSVNPPAQRQARGQP